MHETRLLVLSVDYYPMVGGVSNFCDNVSNEFSKFCEAVFLVVPSNSIPPDNCGYDIIIDQESKVKSKTGKNFDRENTRLVKWLRKIIQDNRINRLLLVHPFYYGPPAMTVAKSLCIECDVIVHGTELASQYPELLDNEDSFSLVEEGSLPFHLLSTLKRARKIIANSQYTLDFATKISHHPNGLVCGCGISESLFDELKEVRQQVSTERHKASALSLRPRLCYVGRLVPHKKVDAAIELAGKMNAYLDIVGTGPHIEALQRQVNESGLEGSVVFHGNSSDQRKWELIAGSDFLLLPSQMNEQTKGYEGFGIVLLEAVAAGTIPVGSAAQGMADPIRAYGIGIEGLSNRVDVDQTSSILMEFFLDSDAYQQKHQHDMDVIKNNFHWQHVAHRIAKSW